MQILQSSYDAMTFTCPLCNAPRQTRCVQPDGKYEPAIVHPERRALVPISHPGKYVEWDHGNERIRNVWSIS